MDNLSQIKLTDCSKLFTPIRSFEVKLQALSDSRNGKFIYDGIHGALGFALWNADANHKSFKNFECGADCNCLYKKLFAPSVPENKIIKEIASNPPRPYSLFVIQKHENINKNQYITFRLNIIGLSHIASAHIAEAFTFLQLLNLGDDKVLIKLVAVSEQQQNISTTHFRAKDHDLTIQFLTPTRIEIQQNLAQSLPFALLLERILWRARNLHYLYANGSYIENAAFHNIIETYKTVSIKKMNLSEASLERFDKRQNLRGWEGSISYKGALLETIPLLIYGSNILVGSNTVFGMGAYEVIL